MARFAALGVTANMQALWACNEPQMRELTAPLVGAERAATQYPFASILRSEGVDARPRLCAGSNGPVSTPDPWQAIHVAVNRTLLAHEALTLAGALDASRAGSASIHATRNAGTGLAGRRVSSPA